MITRKVISLIIPIVLFVCFLIPINVAAQTQGTVYGTVTNRHNQPVPGVKVSLLHPQLGRSSSSVTDSYGRYAIFGIPIHSAPYYIEVYWGTQLIYRTSILVQGQTPWNIRIQ
jgi:hypothetical protein